MKAEEPKKEYEVLNPVEVEAETEENWNYEVLDGYSYFDFAQIRNRWNFQDDALAEGRKIKKNGNLTLEKVKIQYLQSGEQVITAQAQAKEKSYPFSVQMVINRDRIIQTECNCSRCKHAYYTTYYHGSTCAYISALLEDVQKYTEKNRLGDATDYNGRIFLTAFQEQHANERIYSVNEEQGKAQLVPRLQKKRGSLLLSFKAGEQKLFVVKKLDEFLDNVTYSRVASCGNSTPFSHKRNNFTESSRPWLDFMGKSLREVEDFESIVEQNGGYLRKSVEKAGSIELRGWKLDEFYRLLRQAPVEYENKDDVTIGKGMIKAGIGKPSLQMTIRKTKLKDRNPNEFHGITVSCKLPEFMYGIDQAYYIEKDRLLQVEETVYQKLHLFEKLLQSGGREFKIGRNHLADFYYTLLPQLEDVVTIFEEDTEEIKRYLPPRGRFVFYLDVEENKVFCRTEVVYGTQRVNALDSIAFRSLEIFRERNWEQEVIYMVRRWLPALEAESGQLYCESEDEVYNFLTQGIPVLLSMGEVQCTAAFRNLKVGRKVTVSVGVSVSQGLLNLNVETAELSMEEVEEILGSYRAKKRYHRLRDGSFLSMEDESLATLEEMTKALRMSVKELLQENVQLPLYRALYLDKVLEKNEEIYSNRDRHFKQIVKSFKTVKDSDFVEPESLKQVLRGYQSYGYRWLRTLKEYDMGGILADDMGLGKTIQAITLLLSAKQEGEQGTSLIVAPASLVFNWGEELHRFAPELSVELITGTQTERNRKLERFGTVDVFITSYDLLKRDIASYHGICFLYQILDEAQFIKNHSTAAAKAVKAVESRYRFALTGTPIENRLSELWSIFDFLMPGYLYGYETFRKEFELPIVRGEDESAMERLKRMTSPFILRRLKDQVLKDLPEKLEENRYVKLSGEQKKLYDAQVAKLKQTLAMQDAEEFQKNKLKVLAEITKIRQICCDPALCFENYKGESAKLEACMELIETAMESGHRMLLFSQFTSMLDILAKRLEEQKIPYFTITGSVPKEKRLQLVKEFNEGEVPIFLISLKAGGVGLNLTGADVVIHYDPWWNLAVQNQATDRAHRIGQTKKVVVYKLLAKDSMEEKIQHIQESKKALSDQIVQGDTNQLSEMSKEDFLALFE